MKTKEEITDFIGQRTYSPDEEIARKAPAVICSVASRILRLRQSLDKLKNRPNPEVIAYNLKFIEEFVRDAVAPLPFEADILSGDIVKVDNAIRHY